MKLNHTSKVFLSLLVSLPLLLSSQLNITKVYAACSDASPNSEFADSSYSYPAKQGTRGEVVNVVYVDEVTPPLSSSAIQDSGKSLQGLSLIIDAGHGDGTPGAIGFGLYESTVTLDTSLRLEKLLEKTPINTVMTRSTDIDLSLANRVAIAENANAHDFLSIHVNASGSASPSGTETWYYDGSTSSQTLAGFIQDRLVDALNTNDRGLRATQSIYVLKHTTMTAVLIELGFIDNAEDNAKLKDPAYRQLAAEAIYYGLLDYYQSEGYDVTQYY